VGDKLQETLAELAKNVGELVAKQDADEAEKLERRIYDLEQWKAQELTRRGDEERRRSSPGETKVIQGKVKLEWIRTWGAIIIAALALLSAVTSSVVSLKVAQIQTQAQSHKESK
jgi:hypothetical protein